ncbi:MAG: endonuclease [Oscillospiraceae bacterium]|nr:endonuclease [Oscillospiraceae bacterium]
MKQICKRSLAAFLLLVMLVGYFSGITIRVNAASYVYNWGERGEVATELSDAAEAWYAKYNTSYAKLSAYSGASSVSSVPSSALYQQLKTLMTNAHSFINDYGDNKTFARYTDCQNGGGAISSFYSGKSIGPSWDGTWNREHTWPNSKGLGGSDEDDVMMIRPTSISENSSRGNDAYGKSGGSFYDPNSESGGKYNLHGDVARICLYVYVRWGNTSKMWGSSGVMESKEVLLEWMEEDPVDTWELGRNDAVQSITGTRNVFVDYPELAFDLFNAEIPNNYDTPSGSAPAYTITATSNNTSYGTVSLSGKTITATPKTGYQVAGYTVTSGSATVTRSGNTFTVIPSTNCTVRINFEPRVQSTVTFIDRGITQTTKTAYNGDSITIPALTRIQPDGYLFRGWVEQQITSSQTKPAVYAENASYTVSGNKTFYALYAKVEDGSTGDATYRLVTSADQLTQGTSVVIAAAGTTALAMKQTGGTNNRYTASVTKNADDTITFDENVLIDVLTLGAGTTSGTYSFYSNANGQYLAAGTSSGSNILKLQASVDAAASFTITVDSNGIATVTSKTSSDRKLLQYNSGANIFACYGSAQKAISLYAYMGGGISYYTTNPEGGVSYLPGDIDGNGQVNRDDVIALLLHVSMPDAFAISVPADFNGDGLVTRDDVIQLLLHVSMPENFPLQ